MREVTPEQAKEELQSSRKGWDWYYHNKEVQTADWKESVDEVLKEVDKQLKPHGLEVVQIDTQSDTYAWYIKERK
jgi:hypothetical protein